MSLASVVSTFQSVFNRDDCSAAQAQIYCLQAISRVQREVRLASMERVNVVTTAGTIQWINVPHDLLEIIDVLIPDATSGLPKALIKVSYRQLQSIDPVNPPSHYARLQGQLWIAGSVPAGTQVQLVYFGEFASFPDATYDNEITSAAPDLIVYGALSYAADAFEHPSAVKWEQRYQSILMDVIQMNSDLEMNGGPMAIQPLYCED
jgi:hypothetical protein